MILIFNCVHVTMHDGEVCMYGRCYASTQSTVSNSQLFIKLFSSIQAIIIRGS